MKWIKIIDESSGTLYEIAAVPDDFDLADLGIDFANCDIYMSNKPWLKREFVWCNNTNKAEEMHISIPTVWTTDVSEPLDDRHSFGTFESITYTTDEGLI